jgi:hypothetical protein
MRPLSHRPDRLPVPQGRRRVTSIRHDHPDDLLDAVEVAELHGMSLRQFNDARFDNRVELKIPAPDAYPRGVELECRAATIHMVTDSAAST